MGIVQFPGYGVEYTSQTVFSDLASEQRVCGQGPEGVIANLGIGGGGALSDKVKVRFALCMAVG